VPLGRSRLTRSGSPSPLAQATQSAAVAPRRTANRRSPTRQGNHEAPSSDGPSPIVGPASLRVEQTPVVSGDRVISIQSVRSGDRIHPQRRERFAFASVEGEPGNRSREAHLEFWPLLSDFGRKDHLALDLIPTGVTGLPGPEQVVDEAGTKAGEVKIVHRQSIAPCRDYIAAYRGVCSARAVRPSSSKPPASGRSSYHRHAEQAEDRNARQGVGPWRAGRLRIVVGVRHRLERLPSTPRSRPIAGSVCNATYP
jgi:hypothetical protein